MPIFIVSDKSRLSDITPKIMQLQKHTSPSPAQLAEIRAEYRRHTLASSTQGAYLTDRDQFLSYLTARGVSVQEVTPDTIGEYIAHLDTQRSDTGAPMYAPSTIERKVYALSKWFKIQGIPNPVNSDTVRLELTGLKRKRGAGGWQPDKDQAGSAEMIDAQVLALGSDPSARALRDRLVLLLGFLGGFRRSELASLRWEQVRSDERGYTITLGKTKTDQTGEKALIKVFGKRSDPRLCPVRLLEQWQAINAGAYLLPSITKGGNLKDQPLSGRDINRIVKRHLGDAYSAHSLRSGFVTAARKRGATYDQIMRQTGHADVRTVRGYLRYSDAWSDNAATLF